MNRKIKVVLLLCFIVVPLFYTHPVIYQSFFQVQILSNYDFESKKDKWVLMKGYYGDSTQYVITDKAALKRIKDRWYLDKTYREFATTGGYNVELYKNRDRVMFMDIIKDGNVNFIPGILYNSDYQTLGYTNLKWLDLEPGSWKKVTQKSLFFNSLKDRIHFIDSLKAVNKVTILTENQTGSEYFIHLFYY